MVEAVLPNFYLPGYGLRGVPLYLLGDVTAYRDATSIRSRASAERPTSQRIMARMRGGEMAVSQPVADFWRLAPGTPLLLGLDARAAAPSAAPAAGMLAFLPGIPPKTVSDRQGYVQARIDYLNYLFSSNAYLVAGADNPQLARLQILHAAGHRLLRDRIRRRCRSRSSRRWRRRRSRPAARDPQPRTGSAEGRQRHVHLAGAREHAHLSGRRPAAGARRDPGDRDGELRRGSPHAGAAAHPRRLAGDRCGASWWRCCCRRRWSAWRSAPLAAVLAGFGLANYVWQLREIRTVVQLLPTHLVVAPLTGGVVLLLMVLLVAWRRGSAGGCSGTPRTPRSGVPRSPSES